ncbi:BnaC06g02110D [Brassica napus]|uniref:BnaC06g02110D protein n=1 Tax=Brassica napus TaxID=3708 RepID=A0A078HPX2_BRANA|nr:BnaC06g02110D [Brassica napus]
MVCQIDTYIYFKISKEKYCLSNIIYIHIYLSYVIYDIYIILFIKIENYKHKYIINDPLKLFSISAIVLCHSLYIFSIFFYNMFLSSVISYGLITHNSFLTLRKLSKKLLFCFCHGFSSSSSTSTKMKNNNKLSVRNQTRFKKSFLLLREKTILKKALELSILCDNDICVIHYDREGNLVNAYPEDQSQVKDILQRYNNLSDREKIKKNTNLSQFYNKKLVDEKRRSLTDAEERKRFTKKVGAFKGSLEDKLQIVKDRVRDLLYSQDHQTEPDQSPCLDVIGDHVSASSDQYLLGPASCATDASNHESKFSVFLFNHETATFTQLPNSASSSFDQGLIGTY